MDGRKYLIYSAEVANAKATGKPIVALESTIIAHGMPFPQNVETALEMQSIIRNAGAVPALIVLQNGKIHIGLSDEELHEFAQNPNIAKSSRRDLPVFLALKRTAATTVATTMYCASLAGIHVFATGGIGGVHRGAAKTFDVSADLQELAQTQVAVVSAGAKAILDLKLTLEYLETSGVTVLGYKSEELAAFYSQSSGLALQYGVESPEEVAAIMQARWNLGIPGAVLVSNPIPQEDAIPRETIELSISVALSDAESQGVEGKELTPFLLGRIARLTEGKSLKANISLAKNNAKLAAKVAVAFSKI